MIEAKLSAVIEVMQDTAVREADNGNEFAVTYSAMSLPVVGRNTPHTIWLNLIAFGAQIEALAACKKGDTIAVTGALRLSSYKKNGETCYAHQLIVRELTRVFEPEGAIAEDTAAPAA